VSAIVEVDPGVLGDERVQRAVEGRFLDSAISVREAAMELVGRHIASHPDVAVKVIHRNTSQKHFGHVAVFLIVYSLFWPVFSEDSRTHNGHRC
jgi:hypothetical protein